MLDSRTPSVSGYKIRGLYFLREPFIYNIDNGHLLCLPYEKFPLRENEEKGETIFI